MSEQKKTWQEVILGHFLPKRERMLLVIDPHNLLGDPVLLSEIQRRNYDVLEFTDEVSFRNRFERTYRSRWDDGEARHVAVVVHTLDRERYIPYDLLKKSRRIELSVSELFPNLNALVVAQLDHAYYADLYSAHQRLVEHGEQLRLERPTIDFILRAVLELDPLQMENLERWVEFLIRKHYTGRRIPPELESYIVDTLPSHVPKEGIRPSFLQDADAFYQWLGEQWQAYVRINTDGGDAERPLLDLGNSRLRPLLGYLFAEGLLDRVPLPSRSLPASLQWMTMGLSSGIRDSRPVESAVYTLRGRLERFQSLGEESLPSGKTDLRDWLSLAAEWAETVYRVNSLPQDAYQKIQEDLFEARRVIDTAFQEFVLERYGTVDYYEDNKGPTSVAGVNGWLHRTVDDSARVALLCFDGLALDQWYLLRNYLHKRLDNIRFEERRTYAMAPSITPISRQALFSGRPPVEFEDTLLESRHDGRRWEAYWAHRGFSPARVAYQTVQIDGSGLDEVKCIAEGRNLRLGILTNLFDEVMHSVKRSLAEADKRVYYGNLQSHLDNGRMSDLFSLLSSSGYRIFVTSDHGNIMGVGMGVSPPRALVETFARRVAIFDDETLARDFARENHLLPFRTKILPPATHPVYPSGNRTFASEKDVHLSHGGLSLEELVVPFVEVVFS